LRDAKISPMAEMFNASHVIEYANVCGLALAS